MEQKCYKEEKLFFMSYNFIRLANSGVEYVPVLRTNMKGKNMVFEEIK